MTKLGSAMATPTAEAVATRLSAVLAGARVFVDVEIPRTGLVGKMRLLDHDEDQAVTLEMSMWLAGLAVSERVLMSVGGMPIGSRRVLLTLAVAVRDADDTSKPLGTLEEWGQLDDSVIGPVWRRYNDLCDQLDPWFTGEVAADTGKVIRAAIEKKTGNS